MRNDKAVYSSFFAVIITFFCAITAEASEATDPNKIETSIVNTTEWLGRWEGEWTFREANMGGKLVLTILEITDKGKVRALLYTEGPASYHYKDQPAQGQITGNQLTIEFFKFIIYQFVRESDELRGYGIGGARVEAKLRKKK